jgi:hypothetical protein
MDRYFINETVVSFFKARSRTYQREILRLSDKQTKETYTYHLSWRIQSNYESITASTKFGDPECESESILNVAVSTLLFGPINFPKVHRLSSGSQCFWSGRSVFVGCAAGGLFRLAMLASIVN